jgi:hypothetical protein
MLGCNRSVKVLQGTAQSSRENGTKKRRKEFTRTAGTKADDDVIADSMVEREQNVGEGVFEVVHTEHNHNTAAAAASLMVHRHCRVDAADNNDEMILFESFKMHFKIAQRTNATHYNYTLQHTGHVYLYLHTKIVSPTYLPGNK